MPPNAKQVCWCFLLALPLAFPLSAVCIPPMENMGVALHPELLTPVQIAEGDRPNSQANSLYDGLALYSQGMCSNGCHPAVSWEEYRRGGARRSIPPYKHLKSGIYNKACPLRKSSLDLTQRGNDELKTVLRNLLCVQHCFLIVRKLKNIREKGKS